MDIVILILALLVAVIVSGFIVRIRLGPVRLPLPIVQIVLGAILWYALGIHAPLSPSIFFLVFIPPLLFFDGWRIPQGVFFRELRTILLLAIGLVLFTVIGMGPLIDWLIPAIPLSVAFALAAILSPTDPVAVSAILADSAIPPRLMHILEGESLLNDSSGLVCFRFAVAAALTGSFSLTQASWTFALLTGGGVVVGVIVSWGIELLNRLVVSRTGEEPVSQILISLLIPFAAYLVGEHLDVSGILAAAAAGLAMPYAERVARPLATTRLQRNIVWQTVQTALNGTMFVLIGQQLPHLLKDAGRITSEAGLDTPWRILGYIVAIAVAMALLRMVWVWASLSLTLFARRRRGYATARPSLRVLLVTALAGVRGAITFAGILALPLVMPDGSPFPARELAILLAMGVILFWLVAASIALPLLSKNLDVGPEPSTPAAEEQTEARHAAAEAAIRRLEQLQQSSPIAHDFPDESSRLIELYHQRLDERGPNAPDPEAANRSADATRRLRIQAIQAERDELYQLRKQHKIGDATLRKLVHEIDLIEASLAIQISKTPPRV